MKQVRLSFTNFAQGEETYSSLYVGQVSKRWYQVPKVKVEAFPLLEGRL